MKDPLALRWAALGLGLLVQCSSTAAPSTPLDGGAVGLDGSAPDVSAADAADDADATAADAAAAAADAPTSQTCENPLPLAERWVVPDLASASAPRCELGGTESAYAWASIEVPARAVLVLRSSQPSRGPDQVSLFSDCAATACLPTVSTTTDGFVVRRFFNDAATPRTVRIAARRGVIVFTTIERTPPNLRCDDARLIEREGPVVEDGPFPAIDPAPACPEVYAPTGPVRWYRVAIGHLPGNTLVVNAPPDIDVRLVTACDAPSCAAAPYLQVYNATRTLLRWPVARDATAPLYLAVQRRPINPVSSAPITFEVTVGSGIAGRLCADALQVDRSLDLRDFETRSGAERVAVCNDAFGRTTRMRWFDVWLQPGQSLIAHSFELSSTARTAWQLYDDCADRRCGVFASPTSFGTTLEYANTTAEVRGVKLALGNLAPEYVDALRVRVRTFTPAANRTCATARRVAPNAVLLREDLTTGGEGPPPCAVGGPRRALWYITTVPPGHELAPRLFNSTEPEARVDVPNACPSGTCTATFANRTAVPIEVTYAVSQESRFGFFATYDLDARSIPLSE